MHKDLCSTGIIQQYLFLEQLCVEYLGLGAGDHIPCTVIASARIPRHVNPYFVLMGYGGPHVSMNWHHAIFYSWVFGFFIVHFKKLII